MQAQDLWVAKFTHNVEVWVMNMITEKEKCMSDAVISWSLASYPILAHFMRLAVTGLQLDFKSTFHLSLNSDTRYCRLVELHG